VGWQALSAHTATRTTPIVLLPPQVDACPLQGLEHEPTDCPFLHPREKARRRDPRLFPYSGTPCPEFRKVSG
jgi:hypothetical protein